MKCNLSMKEDRLFCFLVMRSTKLGCFRLCSWRLWKALDNEGCIGLVPWLLDFQCKSSWILNDFFTENFGGIGMCLWCCWKDLDEQDLMEFIWYDLNSECERYWFESDWFLLLKIQINSKKPGFGRKNQLKAW
jgi:hypothetical protein